MENLYISKALGDVSFLFKLGWLSHEINQYIPLLDSFTDKELLHLHEMCGIKMFSSDDNINHEEAINVLLNPHDVGKEELFSMIQKLKQL